MASPHTRAQPVPAPAKLGPTHRQNTARGANQATARHWCVKTERKPAAAAAASGASRRKPPTTVDRRIALTAAVASAVGAGALVPTAWGLLPDDDDAELIERAKASRSRRIKSELETERKYAKDSGFRDRRDDKTMEPIQRAVAQLAKSASMLESGDVSGAASVLGEGDWLAKFDEAGLTLSRGNGGAERGVTAVVDGIKSLGVAANKGDARQSKREFVQVAAKLFTWASEVGITSQLKGL